MPGIARITDMFTGVCTCHPPSPPIPMGGIIITSSNNAFSNNLGIARLTDIVIGFCGHTGVIISASNDTSINNLGTARIGDAVVGCLIGIIVTGGGDSLVNN